MTAPTTIAPPAETTELDLRSRKTFRCECLRSLGGGILETAGTTFLMLIAVRYFAASDTMKSLTGVNDRIGLLLSPVIVTFVMIRQFRAAKAAAALTFVGGLGFIVAAIPHVACFVFGSIFALTCGAAAIPLTTQIYQDNYPTALRGKLFSRQLFIRIGTAVFFGLLLSITIEYITAAGQGMQFPQAIVAAFTAGKKGTELPRGIYQSIMGTFAAAMFLGAFALSRIPSSPLTDPGREARNPFYALRFVRDDKTFRNTLIAWMFIGIANLVMVALRVEYLANTERFQVTLNGHALTTFEIVLLTDIIPNASRLAMSPIWGRVFDRLNFFLFRIAINLGFGVAIVTFFTGETYVGHAVGAIIWGISIAGGDLCWTLWVTKLAPAHRVAHYMSVHTFLTGIRGIAAPFIAFVVVRHLSLGWMAAITASMIILSCLILLPELGAKRPLVREVEEQTAD